MANKNIRGITIEIGGDTTKLGKAIEESEQKSKSLQTELREIDRALKFDPSNVELLAQKQTVLTQNIEATSKKLDTLKEAEKQVIAQFERGEVAEEQVRALQREIIKTEGVLGSMEKALSGVGNESDDLAKSFKKVDDSTDDANGGFTIMKGALADLTANAIQGAINAIGNFVSSLFELSEATEEYRVMQNKLSGSADTFGYSVDFANEKYKEFYGYLGDDQMSTNAITNLMGLGTSTENISKLAESAIAVWTAYGDSIPIESLTESINETAQVGKVTGSLADALNWAGISEDEFNAKLEKTTSVQERADMIAQVLNDTYGESKTKYDELSGSITDANKAELELKDTQAELGKTMEPVNTAIKDLKAKALEAILPVVQDVAQGFLDLLTWAKENPGAMQALTAVVSVLATSFTILAGALAIQSLISGVTKAIALLNTTLLANPIVLIVSAIAGLVAGFIYLWNNCEAFREFWINLWDNIVSFFNKAWEGIVNFFTVTIPEVFTGVINWIKENWDTLLVFLINPFAGLFKYFYENNTKFKEFVDNAVSFIKELPSKIWEWLLKTIDNIGQWIVNTTEKAKEAGSKFVNNVITFFKELPSKVWKWLVETVKKAKQWVTDMVAKAKEAGTQFINKVIEFVKTLPSKVWEWLKSTISKVTTWISDMTSKAKDAGSKFVNNVIDFVKQLPSKVWEWLKSVLTKVTEWGGNLATKAKEAGKKLMDNVVNAVKGLPDKIKSIGSDIVRGLWNGINNMSSWIGSKIKSFGDGVLGGIKDFFGIKSPSRVMADEVGKYLPQGIAVGIDNNAKSVLASVKELTNETIDTAKKSLSGLNITIPKATVSGVDLAGNTPLLDYETGRTISNVINAPDTGYHADNTALASKMDEMIRAFKNMKQSIVLDSGVLVGETINQFDEALGNTYSLRARRV